MLVTQREKKRPGLADGMMDDKGEKRFAKQMTKMSRYQRKMYERREEKMKHAR
jgi:hypothetical protein